MNDKNKKRLAQAIMFIANILYITALLGGVIGFFFIPLEFQLVIGGMVGFAALSLAIKWAELVLEKDETK